jgi:hypothetical protein
MGPLLYALSKILWANLFFGYRGVEPTPQELARRSGVPEA